MLEDRHYRVICPGYFTGIQVATLTHREVDAEFNIPIAGPVLLIKNKEFKLFIKETALNGKLVVFMCINENDETRGMGNYLFFISNAPTNEDFSRRDANILFDELAADSSSNVYDSIDWEDGRAPFSMVMPDWANESGDF